MWTNKREGQSEQLQRARSGYGPWGMKEATPTRALWYRWGWLNGYIKNRSRAKFIDQNLL